MFYSSFSGSNDILRSSFAQLQAQEAKSDAREAQTATILMQQDIDRLLMITQALWTLLKQQHNYTDDDLMKEVMKVDMQDGMLDGKGPKSSPATCPNCNRVNSSNRIICIYCGKPLPMDLFSR